MAIIDYSLLYQSSDVDAGTISNSDAVLVRTSINNRSSIMGLGNGDCEIYVSNKKEKPTDVSDTYMHKVSDESGNFLHPIESGIFWIAVKVTTGDLGLSFSRG